jgi:hypothetical protein
VLRFGSAGTLHTFDVRKAAQLSSLRALLIYLKPPTRLSATECDLRQARRDLNKALARIFPAFSFSSATTHVFFYPQKTSTTTTRISVYDLFIPLSSN